MRGFAAGLLVLVSAGVILVEAQAQPNLAPNFLTKINPHEINSVKMDTSRALRPPNTTKAFASQRQLKPIGLNTSTVFPKISLGSWPPTLPTFSFLQGKNPYQPNPIRGVNPFDPPKKKK